jgi:S-adenosylmethionine:tRNA ribosyltransferase-isomerase
MKLEDFRYELPPELIAQYPLTERASSRLLVLDRKSETVEHRKFFELGEYLEAGDVLVVNDTKVFKARLFGRKESGGRVEVLLIRRVGGDLWEAMIDKSRRVQEGARIAFDRDSFLTVEKKERTRIQVRFNRPAETVIKEFGVMPLPHYIRRSAEDKDIATYQTVYAKNEGSIAAPTAGLHFTSTVLDNLMKRGVEVAKITLHVGPGTFKPIRVQNVENHEMEAEFFEITDGAAGLINRVPRVVAVGTTVTRTLEYAARNRSGADDRIKLAASTGWADIFIYPGFEFRVVGKLVTNFHLPGSTPLMLVCALAGRELIFKAYKEAIREKYRFYSYGDAMLIV